MSFTVEKDIMVPMRDGVRLDREVDWAEIAELCLDAYRAVAPARLAARLDGS